VVAVELQIDDEALGFPSPLWMRDAACIEHPDVEFFPARG
jgi:hypothetical protein